MGPIVLDIGGKVGSVAFLFSKTLELYFSNNEYQKKGEVWTFEAD